MDCYKKNKGNLRNQQSCKNYKFDQHYKIQDLDLFTMQKINLTLLIMIHSEQQKKQYLDSIELLINKLNQLSSSSQSQQTQIILLEIKQIDMQFIEDQKFILRGNLLFTRHGQCNNWSQKKFGLNPNSPLCQQSFIAMKRTNQLTKELLFFHSEIPRVRVSPMVRTKQTASVVLHRGIKYDLQQQIGLTENSSKPASTYITSFDQFKSMEQKTSFFENFKKALTFKLSSFLYGEQSYAQLSRISFEADTILNSLKVQKMKKQNNEETFIKGQMTKADKIEKIREIVKNCLSLHNFDVWFFGHSKNLKAFFKHELRNKKQFTFCETRRVYAIENEDKEFFYMSLPYIFKIDQENGCIRGLFLGGLPDYCKIT